MGERRSYTPGTFGWADLATADGEAANWANHVGDRVNAGTVPLLPDASAPRHWLVSFGSEGVDAEAGDR